MNKLKKLFLVFVIATVATTSLAPVNIAFADDQTSSDNLSGKKIIGGLLAIGLAATLLSGHSDQAPPQNQGAPKNITAEEQRAFDLLNADRQSAGLAPLRLNLDLVRLARNYAQDMINRNFFSHNDPDGRTPFDRMRLNGISYSYAGENLAINSSVDSAERAFMNSSGHRANIMNRNYTEVGIGVRRSSSGSLYVVQEFIGR